MAGAAEGYAMVNRAVIPNLGSFTDDNAHAVVDKQAVPDGRARMNFDAGHMTGKLGKRTREKEMLMFVQPMRLTVVNECVKALIEQKNFKRGARSRIAVANRARVIKQPLENHKAIILSKQCEFVIPSIIAALV